MTTTNLCNTMKCDLWHLWQPKRLPIVVVFFHLFIFIFFISKILLTFRNSVFLSSFFWSFLVGGEGEETL